MTRNGKGSIPIGPAQQPATSGGKAPLSPKAEKNGFFGRLKDGIFGTKEEKTAAVRQREIGRRDVERRQRHADPRYNNPILSSYPGYPPPQVPCGLQGRNNGGLILPMPGEFARGAPLGGDDIGGGEGEHFGDGGDGGDGGGDDGGDGGDGGNNNGEQKDGGGNGSSNKVGDGGGDGGWDGGGGDFGG
ncbi:hypothetical protein FRB93_012455 [Tulasnella sp. JGI-2019a]|nr:hypothetical protein FRB93_012455 [Tulasnella sp. JGI-2019a]